MKIAMRTMLVWSLSIIGGILRVANKLNWDCSQASWSAVRSSTMDNKDILIKYSRINLRVEEKVYGLNASFGFWRLNFNFLILLIQF